MSSRVLGMCVLLWLPSAQVAASFTPVNAPEQLSASERIAIGVYLLQGL